MATPLQPIAPHRTPLGIGATTKHATLAEANDRAASIEQLQNQLHTLQQYICELIVRNQELRMALMEAKSASAENIW